MLSCRTCSTGVPVTERKTIRQLRQERGWTQQALAWRLGVNEGTLSLWERGIHLPQQANRLALADLFGVSVEAIAFGPAEPAPG